MDELSYIVFTDFDGTITVTDIGDALFGHFGDRQKCSDVFDLYRTGQITAKECWRRGCKTVPAVSKDELQSFALTHAVDGSFKEFVSYCTAKKIGVSVLSDGFDVYIDPVLKREGLDWLPRFSNTLQFNPDGTMEPVFPYPDANCDRCANCKRNHLLTNSGDHHVIVYIGDGYSDRCPVQYADVVFAKDSLVSFCETRNITFHRFETFADVLVKFTSLVEQRKPRKRRTAELARKEIFMME